MSKLVSLEDMTPVMLEIMEAGGEAAFAPSGISMLPMLHHRTDKVVLVKPEFPLKKYDLPLYRRDDGRFILHRVVEVKKDGTYVMCGDNLWVRETGIRDDNIIGVVKSFERNGVHYECTDKKYIFYCKFWNFIYPLRKFAKRSTGFIIRKLIKIKRILAGIK